MNKIIHKKGEKIGWVVDINGKSCPHFFCSVTNKPITPENPGMIYWNPSNGDLVILSHKGEDKTKNSDLSGYYSQAIDVLSYYIFHNSTPKDKRELEERIRNLDQIG